MYRDIDHALRCAFGDQHINPQNTLATYTGGGHGKPELNSLERVAQHGAVKQLCREMLSPEGYSLLRAEYEFHEPGDEHKLYFQVIVMKLLADIEAPYRFKIYYCLPRWIGRGFPQRMVTEVRTLPEWEKATDVSERTLKRRNAEVRNRLDEELRKIKLRIGDELHRRKLFLMSEAV